MKSEIGELQGKMTVLLADNERLKSQLESLDKEKTALVLEKAEIETKMRTDYILRYRLSSIFAVLITISNWKLSELINCFV